MRIEELSPITLVGKSLSVTLLESRIQELWKYFSIARKDIQHIKGTASYAVEEYPGLSFFQVINPYRHFKRWAAVEVSKVEELPQGLKQLDMPAGKYAVFSFTGSAKEAQGAFQYIYQTWLKESPYQLADRPHFAKMEEGYNPSDFNAQEEFWIPIQ